MRLFLTTLLISGLVILGCGPTPPPVVDELNAITLEEEPMGDEILEVDTLEASPTSAIINQYLDKTPASFQLLNPPVINYTGGQSISTPKFVLRRDPYQFIDVINPCYQTGLESKTLDLQLSLAYNKPGVGVYTFAVYNSANELITLYKKVAMGAAVPEGDSTYAAIVNGYGQTFAVHLTEGDGPKIRVRVFKIKDPQFYAVGRKVTYQRNRAGGYDQIFQYIGYQGAHCMVTVRGA